MSPDIVNRGGSGSTNPGEILEEIALPSLQSLFRWTVLFAET
jgi:hypothetical protein